jgi:hypothetical protein
MISLSVNVMKKKTDDKSVRFLHQSYNEILILPYQFRDHPFDDIFFFANHFFPEIIVIIIG